MINKIKILIWRFERWLNNATTLVTDKDYKYAGYKHMYRDLDGSKIYFMKTHTYDEKAALRKKVIEEFGHLVYVIKVDLQSGESKKVSIRAFKNSVVKKVIQEKFEDAMVNWEDTPEKNIVINTLLENDDNKNEGTKF